MNEILIYIPSARTSFRTFFFFCNFCWISSIGAIHLILVALAALLCGFAQGWKYDYSMNAWRSSSSSAFIWFELCVQHTKMTKFIQRWLSSVLMTLSMFVQAKTASFEFDVWFEYNHSRPSSRVDMFGNVPFINVVGSSCVNIYTTSTNP